MVKHKKLGGVLGTGAALLLAACGADYGDYAASPDQGDELGSGEQAVAACEGDDLQYDFNAFTASLAAAVANELGRWSMTTDFVVSNGKLALSSTGNAFCGTGCTNVKDILLLQEDVTGSIPYHSPSQFRSHLVGWYNAQQARLTDLALESRLPPGGYQFKNRYSNKYLNVDNGSLNDGAIVEQGPLNGDVSNWVVSVVGAKHKFQNKKSGKCLDLASASSADNIGIVQKTCSTASTQNFDVVKEDSGYYALKTSYGKEVVAFNWGTGNDVKMVQVTYQVSNSIGHWTLSATSGTANPATSIFKGVYALSFANAGTSKVAAPVSSAEGAQVKLAAYSASNLLHQWYAAPVNGKYQFINRSSGKCLALASDSPSALLVQKSCAVNDSQLFSATSLSQAEHFSLKTRYGTMLEAQYSQTGVGTPVAQVSGGNVDPQRRIRFSPMMAAEPHKLSFSHVTHDAACGDYYWYDITQPNGSPLNDSMATYIHLIFAGGKTTYNGADQNPFIAQLSTGGQVAIDPSGYMTGNSSSTSGSCLQTDLYYDSTKSSAGKCCIKYTGAQSTFKTSSWSASTFLCQ
ncbi:MAG: RICIN domain-containing protein [Deltaproteobacteria bacterium]